MHMLMPVDMHMHPMLRIRFERCAPISAPAARDGIGAKRAEADIGAGAWRKGLLWIQKKPGVLRRQASRFLALCFTWRQEAANHHELRLSPSVYEAGARPSSPAMGSNRAPAESSSSTPAAVVGGERAAIVSTRRHVLPKASSRAYIVPNVLEPHPPHRPWLASTPDCPS